jgi:hypothetical protein
MKPWKVVVLTVIGVFLVIVLFNLFRPVIPQEAVNDKMVKAYEAYMDEQKKKNDKYYMQTEDAMDRARAISDLSLDNQKRFQKLLDRWEKQTDRMDRVLAKMEKRR